MSEVPEGYARMAAHGWDTWQECHNWRVRGAFAAVLDERQAEAREASAQSDAAAPLVVGDERFSVMPTGAKGGTRWVLKNDDMLVLVRSPKCDWSVSVRFTAAGLWEHGLSALRARFAAAMQPQCEMVSNEHRVNRADYCFDFHAPDFASEFRPSLAEAVVCHSSTKAHTVVQVWSRGAQGETLDIGSKKSCQVALYDKTKEIVEASGKEWMYDLWADALDGECPDSGVWRLEIRFAGQHLKDRSIHTAIDVLNALPELIAEALHTRRLTVPKGSDSNRRRWPLHPLWVLAYEARKAETMRPLGRKITMRREQLKSRLLDQIAGTMRTVAVLSTDGSIPNEAFDEISRAATDRALTDGQAAEKEAKARERYVHIDEAR